MLTPEEVRASIAAKTRQRLAVDNQGRPIDPNAPQWTYHYDAAGRLIERRPVTPEAGDDPEGAA